MESSKSAATNKPVIVTINGRNVDVAGNVTDDSAEALKNILSDARESITAMINRLQASIDGPVSRMGVEGKEIRIVKKTD